MPAERSGAGDPVRTLALLWRRTADIPRHGPRPMLSIDAVVVAATGLADAVGLDAVTMRRVAAALNVSPMTLYTYVPSKAELLDLMLDAAYARMAREDTAGQPWRRRLRAIADENMALFATHPWAADISTVRPPLGPGQIAKYEHELSALDGLGLDDVEMDAALTYLLGFVQGCARAAADARSVTHDSGLGDAQWWEKAGPLLASLVDERSYPLAARVGSAAGAAHRGAYGPDHAYEFGLERLLDGLGGLVDRRV